MITNRQCKGPNPLIKTHSIEPLPLKMTSSETDSNVGKKRPYSESEDSTIIKYIIEHDAFDKVKGVSLWKEMEIELIAENIHRSWHSLKERFRKILVPKLEDMSYDPVILEKLLAPFPGVKPKRAARREKYRLPFNRTEDLLIIKYVMRRKQHVCGNALWKAIEQKGVIPGRSWSSLRSRFLTFIVHNASDYLEEDDAKRLKNIARGDDSIVEYSSDEGKPGPSKKRRPKKENPEPAEKESDEEILGLPEKGSDEDEQGPSKPLPMSPPAAKKRKQAPKRPLLRFNFSGHFMSPVLELTPPPAEKQNDPKRQEKQPVPEQSLLGPPIRSKRKNLIDSSDSEENNGHPGSTVPVAPCSQQPSTSKAPHSMTAPDSESLNSPATAAFPCTSTPRSPRPPRPSSPFASLSRLPRVVLPRCDLLGNITCSEENDEIPSAAGTRRSSSEDEPLIARSLSEETASPARRKSSLGKINGGRVRRALREKNTAVSLGESNKASEKFPAPTNASSGSSSPIPCSTPEKNANASRRSGHLAKATTIRSRSGACSTSSESSDRTIFSATTALNRSESCNCLRDDKDVPCASSCCNLKLVQPTTVEVALARAALREENIGRNLSTNRLNDRQDCSSPTLLSRNASNLGSCQTALGPLVSAERATEELRLSPSKADEVDTQIVKSETDRALECMIIEINDSYIDGYSSSEEDDGVLRDPLYDGCLEGRFVYKMEGWEMPAVSLGPAPFPTMYPIYDD